MLLSGEYDYEVVSDRDTEGCPDQHEAAARAPRTTPSCRCPGDLKTRLKAIAEPIVANIDPDGRRRNHRSRPRARSLSPRFRSVYLHLADGCRSTHKLDPVEDFLVNRKSGHCEYFASALALLLRSVDIRSRIVNGFKGGDWNDLTETLNVRQKHAHSWVEAYAGHRRPG